MNQYYEKGSLVITVQNEDPTIGWVVPRLGGDIKLPPHIGDVLTAHSPEGYGELELFFWTNGEVGEYYGPPEKWVQGWEDRDPSEVGVFMVDDKSCPLSEGMTQDLFNVLSDLIMEAPTE